MSVENPLENEVTLHVDVSNPTEFTVRPSAITVAPFGRQEFEIEYAPSLIGEEQTCTVVLSHPDCGRWVYHVAVRFA